ncbi:DNA alkylation repair protein [Carboxylicivirga caseinilyticus]|uniref:DNA alkylation repair protein n=1 Tax=Carboxylicivirga caseinilyticus TaxID=3417572 RepID=UPI003D35923C|nr:DNA alkylation repair protein [Marinilabiliaceae bacterium A049]
MDEIATREEVDLDLVLQTAELLVPTGKYEDTIFAFSLASKFKKDFTKDTFSAIEKWFLIGISNWAHTDTICGELTPYFLDKGIVTLEDFDSWRIAKNKFQRRAVPVSFIKPFKKGYDLNLLLDYIDPLMMDKERVVHQGLGWFLRECWKKDPMPVERFLQKWKNDAARLIFQYATEKMTKEYRQNFRKEKK